MTIYNLSRTLDVFFIAFVTLVFCAAIWPRVRDSWKKRKRRRARPTAADALKVIRQVMDDCDFTYSAKEAKKLWHILTALRGPDVHDYELKLATTAVIRYAVYGDRSLQSGSTNPDHEIHKKSRASLTITPENRHFVNHAKEAFTYLKLEW